MDTREPIPRFSVTRPRMEPGFVSERVPLSGVVASLLLRPGRMLNAAPKSTGPDSFSLDAPPFRTAAYNYGGLVNETPASYAVSAIPRGGTNSEFNLIFQTTASKRTLTRKRNISFGVPCSFLPSRQRRPSGASKGLAGVHPALPSLWPWRESACGVNFISLRYSVISRRHGHTSFDWRDEMYIEIKQKIECSKCGSPSWERFFDQTYTGLRCLRCGHEKKELQPHLKHTESSGSVTWSSSDQAIKF